MKMGAVWWLIVINMDDGNIGDACMGMSGCVLLTVVASAKAIVPPYWRQPLGPLTHSLTHSLSLSLSLSFLVFPWYCGMCCNPGKWR